MFVPSPPYAYLLIWQDEKVLRRSVEPATQSRHPDVVSVTDGQYGGALTVERIETVVIGGGQAGLAMSRHLAELRRDHVILERARVAESWRTQRWDSLMFQFP